MIVFFIAGGRYTQDMYGLHIQNITTADDGIYYCRAEVDAEGRYDERAIEVIVYSKFKCASACHCSSGFTLILKSAEILHIQI